MSRIIFVPQYPTPNRYQEWWFWKFPEEFRKAGFEVITLGENYSKNIKKVRGSDSLFSPIKRSIEFELQQISEFISLELKKDDILFLADLSFPGIFSNILFHHQPSKLFAFCHATSLNIFDYFEEVRLYKYPIEQTHADMFDKVFVGSNYHARKLHWKNVVVTSLPNPDHLKTFKNEEKVFDIVSASRPGKQKVDSELEREVEEFFQTTIIRRVTKTAEEYYKFLGQAKILLITSHEDTFGYQIVDAINNNCIPLAPTRCSYPELLPRIYLYKDKEELLHRIDYILNSGDKVPVPKLLCQKEMSNFYNRIIKEIKGE